MSKTKLAPKDNGPAATELEIERWPIARLKAYKRNAKSHPPEQIELLARIIKKHGFDVPIVVDGKGVIVKGHGRWLAAKSLGMATVPVIARTDLSPAEAAEARIADNRVAEFGWDFDALVADVVGNLKDGLDPGIIGWSLKDLGLEEGARVAEAQPLDALPVLPTGDTPAFHSVTFTLSEEQLAQIQAAIDTAKENNKGVDLSNNKNSNAAALFKICVEWLDTQA